MNTPMITWFCIVGIVVLVIAWRLVKAFEHSRHSCHDFIRLGSEREEIFVPGDPNPRDVDTYRYEDEEDLL